MINKVILVGNVGGDPEIRTFEDGTKVARMSLATSERFTNSKTGQKEERTQWHSVTLWRGLANVAEQYIRKGSQVYIEGRLNYREWTDAQGIKRYGVDIIADNMQMLGRRQDNQQSQQGSYANQQPAYAQSYSHQQQAPAYQQQAPAQQQQYGQNNPNTQYSQNNNQQQTTDPFIPTDDDLPF